MVVFVPCFADERTGIKVGAYFSKIYCVPSFWSVKIHIINGTNKEKSFQFYHIVARKETETEVREETLSVLIFRRKKAHSLKILRMDTIRMLRHSWNSYLSPLLTITKTIKIPKLNLQKGGGGVESYFSLQKKVLLHGVINSLICSIKNFSNLVICMTGSSSNSTWTFKKDISSRL